MVGPFFIPFGTPPVQDMLKKMMAAGNAALEWIQAMTKMDGDSTARFGIPGFAGGATKAPYDILGDTMRGTRGLMLDKFRQPEKVLEACERLVPLAIDWGVRAVRHQQAPVRVHPAAQGRRRVPQRRGLPHVLLADAQEGPARASSSRASRRCASPRAATTTVSRPSTTRRSRPAR